MVRFEYKHFAFLGRESFQAAIAAECANEQGEFWPYHDTIFANQRGENLGAFSDTALSNFAAALNLDQAAFDDCLDDGTYDDVVQAEVDEGQARGVNSTPSIFVNGEKLDNIPSFAEFQQIIDSIVSGGG